MAVAVRGAGCAVGGWVGFGQGAAVFFLPHGGERASPFLGEKSFFFSPRFAPAVESFAQDLRVAEVATAVLVYLHMEAARRQAIVEIAIADYGEIASCCGHFFGVEFLGQPVAFGAVAEVDAHYQRVVLLGY